MRETNTKRIMVVGVEWDTDDKTILEDLPRDPIIEMSREEYCAVKNGNRDIITNKLEDIYDLRVRKWFGYYAKG